MTRDVTGWLSASQAARRLEVTRAMVHVYCRKGKLEFVATPLGRLIEPASVDALAQTRARRKQKENNAS